MELEFEPQPLAFFEACAADDPVAADLMVLCEDIAGHIPPSRYPGMQRLKGNLRDIFYYRYYRKNRSMRLYFCAGSGKLLLIHLNENKRQTKLKSGEEAQLKSARDSALEKLKAAKAELDRAQKTRSSTEPQPKRGKSRRRKR